KAARRAGRIQGSASRTARPEGSTGLAPVGGARSAPGLPWMASKPSWRWTGTSLGATIPSRTLSPRISTTVTVMSLLMTMLSFFFLDSTNIAAYPSWKRGAGPGELIPTRSTHAGGGSERAGEGPLPLEEPGMSLGGQRLVHEPPLRVA